MNELQDIYINKIKETDLEELNEIEQYFHFTSFHQDDAIKLGSLIVEQGKKLGPVAIRIIDEKQNIIVYQAIMEGRDEHNLLFVDLKRNAVLETGHCSYYAFVESSLKHVPLEELFHDQEHAYVTGAFPIYVNDELQYTVAVSGLKDGKDFSVVVNAIADFLQKEIPSYHGYLI